MDSLCPADSRDAGSAKLVDGVDWTNAGDIEGLGGSGLRLFKDGIEPNDIQQGSLGDCYFLSSLAALAEKPERIKQMFLHRKRNPEGVYGMSLCKNGTARPVFVDEMIPTREGRIAYSRAHGQEMWVVVLEKAWAKLHGSYERIEAGDSVNTIRDLIGAPGDSYNMRQADEFEGLWEKIQKADQRDWIISCSIDDRDEQETARLTELGLVPGHAYTCLRVAVLDDGTQLLRIRNPWGNFEWKGDWGDDSDMWTDEKKMQVGDD